MKAYPVLRSTLEGVFGANVGFSDEEATASFLRDLGHPPFRDALRAELDAALGNPAVSWRLLLEECDVAYFDSEAQARDFVVQRIQRPANSHGPA